MAQLPNLAAPEMGAATGLHRHDTRLKLPEEGQHLNLSQLLAQQCTTRGISKVRLEYTLRQVEPDRDNLRLDRPPRGILAEPP